MISERVFAAATLVGLATGCLWPASAVQADVSPLLKTAIAVCGAEGPTLADRLEQLGEVGWTEMAPGERAEAAQAFAISSHWVLLLGPTESLAGNYEKAVRQQLELAALAVTDYQDFAWLRHDVEQPPTFLRMYTNPLSNVPLLDCQIASPVSLSVQEFAQLTGTEAAKSLDWAGGSLTHFKTGADVGPKSVMMITPDPAIFASVGISNVAAFLEIPYAAVGN